MDHQIPSRENGGELQYLYSEVHFAKLHITQASSNEKSIKTSPPAQIRLVSVSRNKMSSHIDKHYCLASVKSIKSFALTFSKDVVLISQNDKAKVLICNPFF